MSGFKPGRYVSPDGKKWFCGQWTDSETIVCNSDDGHMTAASHATFLGWGWTSEDAGRAALSSGKEG